MRRLLPALLFAAVLLVLAIVAIRLGLLTAPAGTATTLTVSPQAAAEAEVKLSRLEPDGEEVRLSEIELTSLFRYRPEVWNLGIVTEPEVRLLGDTVEVSGGVVLDQISAPQLDRFRGFLPDTALVQLRGTVRAVGGASVLDIASVELEGMPIPARLHPQILDRLGRDPADTLPPSSVPLPLPAGIGSARVEGGVLILTP